LSAEFVALKALCEYFGKIVRSLDDADWARPTRCDPMTVKELVTHVSQALDVLLLDEINPPKNTDRVIDRVGYGQSWDGAAAAPRILAGAQKRAAELTTDELVARLDDKIDRAVGHLGALDPEALVGGSGAAIPAAELACVYVIEVGVHTLDLQNALGTDEAIIPEAVPVIIETLDGVLGGSPQTQIAWDDLTYVLACTGRRELSAADHDALGPLAQRFPIIR
jgi:uncharacterized protein (TIGR03083 family)